MPEFTLTGEAAAPVEDVWKLLFDPTRFPEWWTGVETVQVGPDGGYTLWQDGYPDLPLRQELRTDRATGRVTMSCQVFDVEFAWQLAEHGDGTRITVRVDIPPDHAARLLEPERDVIAASLVALATLAEAETGTVSSQVR
jgi:uncharacterized protein YndB with AHSA1/START domain